MMDVLHPNWDRLRSKAEMEEEMSSVELLCKADQPSAEPGRPEIAPRSVTESILSREMRWHHVDYCMRSFIRLYICGARPFMSSSCIAEPAQREELFRVCDVLVKLP